MGTRHSAARTAASSCRTQAGWLAKTATSSGVPPLRIGASTRAPEARSIAVQPA